MAYNDQGMWTPEDDSVANKVTEITSRDSPIMQQARTQAAQQSNARGLLNSSIGVQAGQEAVYKAALPIAAQDANQTFQKNISGQGYRQTEGLQGNEIAANEATQQRTIAADEATQQRAIDANTGTQERSIEADRYLQQQQTDVQREIAQMNLSANDRDKATGAITIIDNNYAQMFDSIQNNTSIPAATRTQYLEHIAALRSTSLGMIEQMYGITLDWGQGTANEAA